MDENIDKKLSDLLRKELAGRGSATIPAVSVYRQNRETISGLRASGWAYADIAGLLSAKGSAISPDALMVCAFRDGMEPSLPAEPLPPPPVRPAPVFTKRRLAESLAPLILEAKESGMSWKEIARQLEASGFSIKPTTLRAYAYPAISGRHDEGRKGDIP